MEDYHPRTYGEAFADVYDEWYADVTDTAACVAAVARLAGGGPVLEMGAGTGRLALPLATAGADVWALDASRAMLAALALLALGIFGPGIANGIVSGGPQLGAGAAVGTGLAAGGMALGTLAGTRLAAGAVSTGVKGAATVAGGASTAYDLGHMKAGGGAAGVAAGMAGMAQAGASAAVSPLRRALGDRYRSGARAAFEATGGRFANSPQPQSTGETGPPAWARRLKQQQALHHGTAAAVHGVRSGDQGGSGTAISLSETR